MTSDNTVWLMRQQEKSYYVNAVAMLSEVGDLAQTG